MPKILIDCFKVGIKRYFFLLLLLAGITQILILGAMVIDLVRGQFSLSAVWSAVFISISQFTVVGLVLAPFVSPILGLYRLGPTRGYSRLKIYLLSYLPFFLFTFVGFFLLGIGSRTGDAGVGAALLLYGCIAVTLIGPQILFLYDFGEDFLLRRHSRR